MKIIEKTGTGAGIDEAKKAALEALNAPEEAEVKFDIISAGKGKVLGLFGGTPAQVRAYYEIEDDQFAKARQYITVILSNLGVENADIDFRIEGEDLRIAVKTEEDYGSVIGRRGETLDAIQYLVRLVINRETDDFRHISINLGNYREKREATLRALAKRNAEKVRKYGRNVVLDPMNPYERRIIHTTIQEIEGVTSHSVGSEDERKVVITLEEGVKPLQSGKGGGNRSRYGGGRGRSSGSSSSSYSPSQTREPRKDSAGSLYGKIEVNKDSE